MLLVNSAKEFWDQLSEMYGQSNVPELYLLKKELSDLNQNNLTVSDYYGKLKGYWDKISSIEPFPECTCEALGKCKCGILKKMMDMDEKNKVIDFLMGLNSGYDNMKQNIIGMDHLPNVNKTYKMVLQVEKQKEIGEMFQPGVEVSALAATKQNYTQYQHASGPHQKGGYSSGSGGYYHRRETKEEKNKKWCDHCKMNRHTVDDCFKVHGYPEWFTKLRSKGERKGIYVANVSNLVEENFQDNPFDGMIQNENKGGDKANVKLDHSSGKVLVVGR
ncbi:hypothetical protein AgCh_015383 [Apium graveolens]